METSFEIKVEKTGIDVSSILDEVLNPSTKNLWEHYGDAFYAFRKTETIRLFGPKEVNGVRETADSLLNNTEIHSIYHTLFPSTCRWLAFNTTNLQRASFIKLYPLQKVPLHRDLGKYFDNVTRYHLGIKGRYKYQVGDSSVIVVPGTLFTFNNQLLHGTQNLDNEDRITLVFDVLKPL